MAAEAAQPRNEQSEEQNRGPDLKIEESRYLSENKIDELGGSAILGARCRMAGRATDKWSELGKEKDEGCMTEDHHKASNVSEVKSATVLVDPWSSSTKGLWQQVDVEHQHLRLGAVEVSGNADGLHGCRPLSFLGANVSDSTNGSYELRKFCKSMSSSKDVRSKQGLVVAEQVVLQGEAVSQQHEDAKSQMRMQILNEAVKAEILDDASKDEESAESGLDDAAGNKLLRSTVFWVLVCFLLIAVFAASVTMGVFAARASGRKAGQIVNEGVGNSDTPTLAPSKSAVNLNVSTCAHFRGWGYTLFDEDPRLYEQEYLLVREELRSNLTRFDVQSLHDDECSPANLAIWWLASEYSFTASPLALGERYGLAVVFLSVKGGTSRDASGWFRSDSSECTWTGVSCRNAGIVSMAAMNVALRGSLPSEIGLLTNLEHVELSKNFIAGTLPPEISELNRLYSLNLFGNSFEGTLPSEYGGLTQLSLLNLGDTFLSGTIPTEYGDLTLLTELNLRDNAIRKGSIPSELGRLTRLENLRLDRNALDGTIPLEIMSLSSLRHLRLDGNNLIGTIHTEIGALTSLRSLRLDDNLLSGTIPSEIGSLARLQVLDLSGNSNLSGMLPAEIEFLFNLNEMYLNSTNVVGTIPLRLCLQGTSIDGNCSLSCACCVGC